MRRVVTILTGISLALLAVCAVNANPTGPFNRIVVFGDSLSDTGNLYTYTGGPLDPHAFPPGPEQGSVYFKGRFSNGPVWVEHFATRLGLAELPPSTEELLPSNLGGANYAWGGAETGDGISARGTPNLGLQIQDFLFSGIQPPLDEQTLVVVWAGPNDFVNNTMNLPETSDVVENLADHITTLAMHGAKHFLVPNMPDLGKVPRAFGTPAEPIFNILSLDFNTKLEARLDELQDSLPGITVIRFDAFALTNNIHFDPQTHGLIDVTGTVKLVVGTDASTFFDPRVVDNPDDYMFFDDVHPTRVTFEIFGDFAFSAVGIGVLTQSLDPANPYAVELFGKNAPKDRNTLLQKLAGAQAKIDQGKYLDAIEKLENFKTKALELAHNSKMAQGDADDLIALAQQVIDCLSPYTG